MRNLTKGILASASLLVAAGIIAGCTQTDRMASYAAHGVDGYCYLSEEKRAAFRYELNRKMTDGGRVVVTCPNDTKDSN